jgi:hypothetical protein
VIQSPKARYKVVGLKGGVAVGKGSKSGEHTVVYLEEV